MSQGNSIGVVLSNPGLGHNFKKLLNDRKISKKVKAKVNHLRSRNAVKSEIRGLLNREPTLFSNSKNTGKTTEQIVEYYYNKLVKFIC